MITFKQFMTVGLNESTDSPTPENIVTILRRDCSQYLNEMPKAGLWRGMSTNSSAVFQEKRVRKDRVPLTSSQATHAALNDIFAKHTGIEYRSASLFLTPSYQQASRFGRPYLVFPIGKIDYCWSPHISDIFSFTETLPPVDEDPVMHQLMSVVVAQKYPEKSTEFSAREIFSDLSNVDKNLILVETISRYFSKLYKHNVGLSTNSEPVEIMMSCDRYYIVSDTAAKTVIKLLT